MKYLNIYSFICCLFLTLALTGQTITVQNLDDSGIGSLRDAISQANSGDTIRFNPTLITQGSDTLVLDTVINIDKDLVIKGLYDEEDTLFLTTGDNQSFFYIDSVENLIIDNLVFIFDSIFLISNHDFINARKSKVKLSNSIFRGNRDEILSFWQSSLEILNCKFNIKMTEQYSSLIVYLTNGESYREFKIINSSLKLNGEILGNSVDIRLKGNKNNNNFIIENSYFKNSKSLYFGHLIININQCTFENSPIDIGHESMGGVTAERDITLNAMRSTFSISDSTDNKNSISCIGTPYGPIESPPLDVFELQFKNCTFNGGTYDSDSYEDYFGPDLDELKITSCIFNDINGFNELPIDSSGGYNLFSFPQSIGLTSTDQANVLVSDINLGPLQNNGGFTPTHIPNYQSLAFNSGNPNDTSSAQNGPIIQRRDIGAAEIQAILTVDTTEYCGESYNWRDETLTESDIHFDVQESTTGSYDSIFVLDLTLEYLDAIAISDGGELKANSSDATYQWIDCSTNQPLFGETNPILTPSTEGTYAVIVSNGICIDTSACVFIDNLSVEEQVQPFVFVKNNILYFNGFGEGKMDYMIFNNLGQQILYSNTSQETQDLSYLESGVYFIEFKSKQNRNPIQFILK